MISPDTHQPIGSCFVFKRGKLFPDVDAVNKWIENDEYHKQKGEWYMSLYLDLLPNQSIP